MNLAALQLVQKYPGLMSLVDLKDMKASDLTKEHVTRIAAAFGHNLPFTEELVDALVALLRGKNIHAVADIIRSPDSMTDLVTFFKGGYKGLIEAKSQPEGYSADADVLFLT